MRRFAPTLALLGIVVIGPGLPGVALAGPPEENLKKGRLAYEDGSYKDAILVIQPLIYPSIALAGERDLVLAYKVLALSYFFESDREAAQREFENLLEIEPTFTLDPLVEPPPAVQFLDEVRQGIEARLKEIRAREERERKLREQRERERLERERKLRLAMREKVLITRVEKRNPWARNLIPFGVPQFGQGRRGLGTFLLVSEGVTGAASLGIWTYLIVKYGGKPVPRLEVADVENLQIAHISLGAAFFGLAIYGGIDAFRHHKSLEIIERQKIIKPTLPPEGLGGEEPGKDSVTPPRPRKSSTKPTTWLSPYLVPGGGGIGMGGTF